MEKAIIIHCTYSDDGDEISKIIQESFRLFLQSELLALAIEPSVQHCGSDKWSLISGSDD